MIEWIQHLGEMRFFPWSPFSWLILGPLYLGGAAVIAFVCWLLAKTWKPAWLLAIPLLLVLAVAPLWEELGIAYNFGKLCKKDAGIFVYKTVEVDGFYDDTRPTHSGQPTPQAAESFDKGGYKFYELVLRDRKGGVNRVVHIEKQDEIWTPTVLDHPTARYHYRWPVKSETVSHKIVKGERVVIDDQTGEVLGRHLNYARKAPWFFVHLDRPNMGCIEVKEDARQRGNVFGPNMVLRSTR